ncbi:MAG: putative addiction module antidote protein [Nitrospinae bacterium]|nr:putative addiction module antidote protein [Nitrospinota bacterium]
MRSSKPYEEFIVERLKDPKDAAEYLNTAMEDDAPRVFLLALKHVAKAQEGGMARICKEARLNRESLYKTLKKAGPRFENFKALVEALGFRISIDLPKSKPAKSRKGKKFAAA